MSRTAETALPKFRFGNNAGAYETAIEETPPAEESSVAMKLLILFVMLLYSSIGVLIPSLEAVRPAMTVAIGAVLFTLIELSKKHTGFRMSWPEGTMLMVMLGVSAVSMFGAIYLSLAAETTLNFAKIVLIYVVIENIVNTRRRLKTIMATMVVGGLIPAIGTIVFYLRGEVVEGSRAAFVGSFGNPNEDAYSLIILIPLAIAIAYRAGWLTRIFMLAATGIFLLSVFLTFSRGGLIALFVVITLLAWKQQSYVLKVLVIALLAGGIAVGGLFWGRKDNFTDISDDTTVNQRIGTIKAGFQMFRDNPLFGVGPGCSIVAYPLYVPKDAHCGCQDQLVVHNAYVQVLSEIGALGFIPFIILIGAAIYHAWKLQRTANPDVRMYAMGLELALWGFAACGLSGGFSWSWFPYLLTGLVAAARQVAHAN